MFEGWGEQNKALRTRIREVVREILGSRRSLRITIISPSGCARVRALGIQCRGRGKLRHATRRHHPIDGNARRGVPVPTLLILRAGEGAKAACAVWLADVGSVDIFVCVSGGGGQCAG